MKADISIAQSSGNYKINVSGRASFECSPPLRSLAKSLDDDKPSSISIYLTNCESMDSTFMGVLAMIGLKAMNHKILIEIINADDFNFELLEGLGITKLFKFKTDKKTPNANFSPAEQLNNDDKNNTVLEAHETLMEVDEANVKKFEKVVELVRKDLDK